LNAATGMQPILVFPEWHTSRECLTIARPA
jgi:hypothetical protein